VLIVVVSIAAYERTKGYEQGKAAADQQIENANAQEARRAQDAQTEVDGCYATGGDWNLDRGVCDHATGR